MGCCGGDREKGEVRESHKWDYITLSDFHSRNCLAPFSYTWLIILSVVSVAVYAADTFTAVNLLAFNKWSSQVKPAIDFNISKWIFAICIILSWTLAGFEWLRAIRVIRRGSVSESYLDPVAAVLQSTRPGGWKRFLVFTELTKSRKGTDYIALFVYFQFKGAIRIILAEGPRQVVNAVTLYSIFKADLVPEGDHAAESRNSFDQFWYNLDALAEKNKEQAVILSTMAFTLTIWVISILSLAIACILFLLFLWHYIPQEDGRLSRYCKRKVDGRLSRIVEKKTRKALEKETKKRIKEQEKLGKTGTGPAEPTLPVLQDDKLPQFAEFDLKRQDSKSTLATMSTYHSNWSATASEAGGSMVRIPTLPSIQERPGAPTRSNTQGSAFSTTSYDSNAPLLSQAGDMGMSQPPMPSIPRQFSQDSMGRPYSPVNRPPTAQGRGTPGPQMPRLDSSGMPYGPSRQNTGSPISPLSGGSPMSPISANGSRRPTGPSPLQAQVNPFDSRSNTPSNNNRGPSYEMSPVGAGPQSPYADHRRNATQDTLGSQYSQSSAGSGGSNGYSELYDNYMQNPRDMTASPRPMPSRVGTPGSGMRGGPSPAPSMQMRSPTAPEQYRAFSPVTSGPGGQPGLGRNFSTPVPDAVQAARRMNVPARSVTAPMPQQQQQQYRGGTPVQRPGTTGPQGNYRGA